MTTKILDITGFAGATLKQPGVDMVDYFDSGDQPHVRIVRLENDTKYDLDGAADSSTVLGEVRARFKLTATAAGMSHINTLIALFDSIADKRGTLTGAERGSGGTTYFTCNARCTKAQMVAYTARSNPPLAAGWRQQVFYDVVWEKMSAWA